MNGSFTPSSASRSATLVWVKPPGLMMANAMPLALRGLHAVDQLVFGVALEGDQLVAELRGGVLGAFFDRCERVRAVDLGFALAQQVQVRAVE